MGGALGGQGRALPAAWHWDRELGRHMVGWATRAPGLVSQQWEGPQLLVSFCSPEADCPFCSQDLVSPGAFWYPAQVLSIWDPDTLWRCPHNAWGQGRAGLCAVPRLPSRSLQEGRKEGEQHFYGGSEQ